MRCEIMHTRVGVLAAAALVLLLATSVPLRGVDAGAARAGEQPLWAHARMCGTPHDHPPDPSAQACTPQAARRFFPTGRAR